jgi:hypothetical protein
MDVYAPADQPLVIFAGDDGDSSLLQSALSRLLGAVGVLGLASLAIQQLYGEGLLPGSGGDGAVPAGGEGGGQSGAVAEGGGAADANATSTETATPTDDVSFTSEETVTDQAANGSDVGGFTVESATDTPTDAPEPTAAETVDTVTQTATETATEIAANATETATATREAAAGVPPGLLFFAGGLFAIAVVAGVLALR